MKYRVILCKHLEQLGDILTEPLILNNGDVFIIGDMITEVKCTVCYYDKQEVWIMVKEISKMMYNAKTGKR